MSRPSKQAERFWQVERARKVARRTPVGTVTEIREPPPFGRLIKPGASCFVDDAIREALDAGLLRGTLEEIRAELLAVCAFAWGAAALAYGPRLTAPKARRKAARVSRLADELLAIVDAIESDRVELEDFVDDWEEKLPPNELASLRGELANLHAIIEHGRALAPLLKRRACQEVGQEKQPPATNFLTRAFFDELGKWWHENAVNVERRGAKAVRNRLAVGLWCDMGQEVPPGYSDEDFAQRGFNLGKIER